MDNMLYILAVLLILLLLTVLVMRRKQAQRFTAVDSRPKTTSAQSRSMGFSSREPKYADRVENIASVNKGATKFDNVTIAERFMDQQRYDKAIETLQRGLNANPHDGPLLLKLLNVYVVANQFSNFDQVYHTLKTYSDQASIEQAEQLKELISDQHATSDESLFSNTMSLDSKPFVEAATEISPANSFFNDDLSLDFESNQAPATTQLAAANNNINSRDQSNDAFNLTLADLETADFLDDTVEELSPNLKVVEDYNLSSKPVIVVNKVAQQIVTNKVANIDDDFTLDLGEFDDQDTKEHSIIDQTTATSANQASAGLNLMHDFALKTKNYPVSSNSNMLSLSDQPVAQQEQLAKQEVDIFALILENIDSEDEAIGDNPAILSDVFTHLASKNILASSVKDTLSPLDALHFNISAFDDSVFEDSAFDDSTLKGSAFEDLAVSNSSISEFDNLALNISTVDDMAIFDLSLTQESVTASNKADITDALSPAPLTNIGNPLDNKQLHLDDMRFDDDNGLDTEAMIAAFDSISNDQKSITASSLVPVQVDALLSKDLDYVKNLNSYQVTLELADHYLQLGEYDSAKRLLIEVIDKGNTEQQQKAQALLTRTV